MSSKRILILGATGMLGHTLLRSLDQYEDGEIFATARNLGTLDHRFPPELLSRVFGNVDANNFNSIAHTLSEVKPDVVINCIGIIKQLPLANDPIASISINSLFPHQLASACRSLGSRLIHISTDCVFRGDKGSYTEDDPSDTTDFYGRTKFLGEVSEANCITLRTSIIGHELDGKYGLVDWFLSQKDTIRGFTQAIYTGFPTVEMARIIAEYVLPNEKLCGLYQLSSDPISKYDLLRLVAKQYHKKVTIDPDKDFFCDRSLNSSKFRTATGYSPPSWKKLVKAMHDDFMKNERR